MEFNNLDSRISSDLPKESSPVAEFARALISSVVEPPVNGALQAVNKAAGFSLPELKIFSTPENSSAATQAGNTVGAVIDFVALSKLLRPVLGEASVSKFGAGEVPLSAARLGIVGGVYTGLLEPSDPDSKTFLKDRLENFGVGAFTAGAAGAVSRGLSLTGVLSSRALGERVVGGAITGLSGGFAYFEANAIFNQHNGITPDLNDLRKDLFGFMTLGAVLGGASGARLLSSERLVKPSTY